MPARQDERVRPMNDPPGMRSVLARPGYRRLWAARTVSQAGDVLQFTTLALLIYQLTGSGLGVSGLVLAEIAVRHGATCHGNELGLLNRFLPGSSRHRGYLNPSYGRRR